MAPTRAARRAGRPRCWLAQFSTLPCSGRLVRVHLIPRQLLKREGLGHLIPDARTWVFGCGGAMGPGGHHGMLDQARSLRVPRHRLPPAVEEIAAEHGLGWWLCREYGCSHACDHPGGFDPRAG